MGNSACCSANGYNSADGANPPIDQRDEVKGLDEARVPGFTTQEMNVNINAGSPAVVAAKEASRGQQDSVSSTVAGEAEEKQFVTYQDGSTYTGLIRDGKRNGHGVWQSKNCQYEGQWKADSQHGQGRQTWSDGRVYEGQFQLGRFAGTGRMVWHTQKGLLVYEGQYQDDLKHGHGKFVWADGRTYDGEWFQGKRHGRGTYITAKAERKVGYWIEDKFDRWEASPDS